MICVRAPAARACRPDLGVLAPGWPGAPQARRRAAADDCRAARPARRSALRSVRTPARSSARPFRGLRSRRRASRCAHRPARGEAPGDHVGGNGERELVDVARPAPAERDDAGVARGAARPAVARRARPPYRVSTAIPPGGSGGGLELDPAGEQDRPAPALRRPTPPPSLRQPVRRSGAIPEPDRGRVQPDPARCVGWSIWLLRVGGERSARSTRRHPPARRGG